MRIFLILTFLSCFAFSAPGFPETISYQGQLLDDNGNVVSDGNYTATFSLFNSSTGGSAEWSEEKNFTTVNGIFNVELGSDESFASQNFEFGDLPMYLEIHIQGESNPLDDRIPLTSVPFAKAAQRMENGEITNTEIGSGGPAAATFTTVQVNSTIDINGGTIDGTDIGATSPSGATFNTLEVTGNSVDASSATISAVSVDLSSSTIYIPNSVGNGAVLTSDGNGNATWETVPAGVSLAGDETIIGNWVNENHPWVDNEVDDALTISGGSIENTPIGATTPTGGTFTSLALTTGASDGHVLTSDANGNASWQAASGGGGGNAVAVRAYKTSNQTINFGNTDQLIFQSESYDLGNNFSSNTFTAPDDGLYLIQYRGNIGTTNTAIAFIEYVVDGQVEGQSAGANPSGLELGMETSLILRLTTNQQLELFLTVGGTSGNISTGSGENTCYITITKVYEE